MKEKIFIFLDIDGVLNSLESLICYNEIDISFINIKRLNYLIENLLIKYQVEIIISSSWRVVHSITEIIEFFTINGFNYPTFITNITPILNTPNRIRGDEIQEYINLYDVKSYIIIDDNSDMLLSQMNNFIQTNFLEGLTFKDCIKILNHFNIDIEYDLRFHTFKFKTTGI